MPGIPEPAALKGLCSPRLTSDGSHLARGGGRVGVRLCVLPGLGCTCPFQGAETRPSCVLGVGLAPLHRTQIPGWCCYRGLPGGNQGLRCCPPGAGLEHPWPGWTLWGQVLGGRRPRAPAEGWREPPPSSAPSLLPGAAGSGQQGLAGCPPPAPPRGRAVITAAHPRAVAARPGAMAAQCRSAAPGGRGRQRDPAWGQPPRGAAAPRCQPGVQAGPPEPGAGGRWGPRGCGGDPWGDPRAPAPSWVPRLFGGRWERLGPRPHPRPGGCVPLAQVVPVLQPPPILQWRGGLPGAPPAPAPGGSWGTCPGLSRAA